MLHFCTGVSGGGARVLARACWMLCVSMCYLYDVLTCLNLCVCLCPGEVDDVLDSICIVHNSGDGHRFAAIMVSQVPFSFM